MSTIDVERIRESILQDKIAEHLGPEDERRPLASLSREELRAFSGSPVGQIALERVVRQEAEAQPGYALGHRVANRLFSDLYQSTREVSYDDVVKAVIGAVTETESKQTRPALDAEGEVINV